MKKSAHIQPLRLAEPASGPAPAQLTLRVSRRAALQLGIAGIVGTALAACGKSSSVGAKTTPVNPAKLTSLLIGTWDFTVTQDYHDGSPSPTYTGTIEVTANTWNLTLGHGVPAGTTPTPFAGDGNGNANGSWQTTSDTVSITVTYGNGPFFGGDGAPWWSSFMAAGLSGTAHAGQQLSLLWNPTLSGNDTDLVAYPGTLDVHIKTNRLVTLTHTMNQPSDPQLQPDKTATTITATKR